MSSPITIQFATAGNQQVQSDIDQDITALNKLKATVDLLNASQVNYFRTAVALEQQHAQAQNASMLQLAQLEAMSRKFETAVASANQQGGQIDAVSTKWRTGANALSVIALTATGATRSMTGLTVAAGTLADSLANVSSNPRLQAWAAGIGAVATGLTIVFAAFERVIQRTEQEGKEIDKLKNEIQELTLEAADENFEAAIQKIHKINQAELDAMSIQFETFGSKAIKTLDFIGSSTKQAFVGQAKDWEAIWTDATTSVGQKLKSTFAIRDLPTDNNLSQGKKLQEIQDDIHKREQAAIVAAEVSESHRFKEKRDHDQVGLIDLQRQINLTGQWHDLTVTSDAAFAGRQKEITLSIEAERIGIKSSNQLWEHKIVLLDQLNEKEKRQQELLLKQREEANVNAQLDAAAMAKGSFTNIGGQMAAELLRIEEKRKKSVADGLVLEVNAEKLAAAEKEKIWADALDAQIGNMRTLEGVFTAHHHTLAKSVGEGIKNIKAVELGYIAIKDTIYGFESAADAVAFASKGNWSAAGMAAIAATKYFAVAAQAAKEAGGGGSGGGGGGGGGGSAGVRDSTRIGATLGGSNGDTQKIEIVIVRQDQNGREISRQRQQFQRLDDRNAPIRVAI